MDKQTAQRLLTLYENELVNNLLHYWLPRCVDEKNGGFFNCFDNRGVTLLSRDKYIWSQGRFMWLWAKLADLKSNTFSPEQRQQFLALAKNGKDFLSRHCLVAPGDWRCVYLTDEEGNPKLVEGYQDLDMSIYVDCFVVNAFGKYAEITGDQDAWAFCKNLYLSVRDRIQSGSFHTLPYPLSPGYRAHGHPMILSNVNKEIYAAAAKLDPVFCPVLKEHLSDCVTDILEHFVDDTGLLREIVTTENEFPPNLFGRHINPGHTVEDMWFMVDAMDLLGRPHMLKQIVRITKRTLETGWDQEYGGLFHYTGLHGGVLEGDPGDAANESMMRQALQNCTGKIWWVHSEALYTTLLLYVRTGDPYFWEWYQKIADYVFEKFPNPDREVREWIQILDRKGNPRDFFVGLPVKDPYHIMRNVALIIELLHGVVNHNGG